MEEEKTYRIRTVVGENAESSIDVKLIQNYSVFEILSLKITQKNMYKLASAGYGVIIGRVNANGNFGIPNAKVSVFVGYDGTGNEAQKILYRYASLNDKNADGLRYNLLPDAVDDVCHQDVGSFPNKRLVLDNNDVIEVFDKYYTFTTTTNGAGDYMIYGVPVGSQQVHVDIDLSDIGPLSQRPRDMVYKGYNINMFESPNKFKTDNNLNSLVQIVTQDKGVYVYPFWGDTTEDDTNASITRCDIDVPYKFEPTCVFMGCVVSDTANNAIGKVCVPDKGIGKMSELVTGEGKIEMIRKGFDGKVEVFSVKGDRVIDGDGTWCYQIPMNLDYVMTDEFGNIVPTDDPEKGIPTRTRVRFRISMDETVTDGTARKRARYLVPNNPKLDMETYPEFTATKKVDYDFGTYTREEDFRDLFWNNVYTVKNYIPRVQKSKWATNKKFTGIKAVNHFGDNNPMPYNNLSIHMTFPYRFLCILSELFIRVVYILNCIISGIGRILYAFGDALWVVNPAFASILQIAFKGQGGMRQTIMKNIGCGISIKNMCDDGRLYFPGGGKRLSGKEWEIQDCACNGNKTTYWDCFKSCIADDSDLLNKYGGSIEGITNETSQLFNCVENNLAQEFECTSFNLQNDWVNGVLYMPLWFRKVRDKKRIFFNLIPIPSADKWCNADNPVVKRMKIMQTCAPSRTVESDGDLVPLPRETRVGKIADPIIKDVLLVYDTKNRKEDNCYGYRCHKRAITNIPLKYGVIKEKTTKYGEYVYYYAPIEYVRGRNGVDGVLNRGSNLEDEDTITLFATDLVLLGNLNDCDKNGIPQLFKSLESTTYNMPPDLVTNECANETNGSETNEFSEYENDADENCNNGGDVETTGADWGNIGLKQRSGPGSEELSDGGLFYGITCSFSYVKPKSCINLSRICELGVSLDETFSYPKVTGDSVSTNYIHADGYVSYDELYGFNERSMFSTMNSRNLATAINADTGFPEYQFDYLYIENFDGSLKKLMEQDYGTSNLTYKNNYKLEEESANYSRFRFGGYPHFYQGVENAQYSVATGGTLSNKNRFPKYDNSFYFYFGLKYGKTAIDKFRSQFYSDCTTEDGEIYGDASISYNVVGNNECEEGNTSLVSYVITGMVGPYTLRVIPLDDTYLDPYVYSGVNAMNCYIGITDSSVDGYTKLIDDEGNDNVLGNGLYLFEFTDAFEEVTELYIQVTPFMVDFDCTSVAFTQSNEEIYSVGNPICGSNKSYDCVAAYQIDQVRAEVNWNSAGNRRTLGGYIKVTDINFQTYGQFNLNSAEIKIEPADENDFPSSDYGTYSGGVGRMMLTSSSGTTQDVCFACNGPFGECYIGVPKGDVYYKVSVRQLCSNDNETQWTTKLVFVPGPTPPTMYVNGIDYAFLSKFDAGWQVYNLSENPASTQTYGLKGWDDIMNVGVSENDMVAVGMPFNTIKNTINKLKVVYDESLSPYYWGGNEGGYTFSNRTVFELVPMMEKNDISVVNGNSPYFVYENVEGEDAVVYYYRKTNASTYPPMYSYEVFNGSPFDNVTRYYGSLSDEEKESVCHAINMVIQNRLDLAERVRSAFTITDDARLELGYSHEGGGAIRRKIYYAPETVNDNDETIVETNNMSLWDNNENGDTIFGIEVPTVNVSGVGQYEMTDFNGNIFKKPYFVGISTENGITLPSGLMWNTSDKISDYFGVHFLGKINRLKYRLWAGMGNEDKVYHFERMLGSADEGMYYCTSNVLDYNVNISPNSGRWFNRMAALYGEVENFDSQSNTIFADNGMCVVSYDASYGLANKNVGIQTISPVNGGVPNETASLVKRKICSYTNTPLSNFAYGNIDFYDDCTLVPKPGFSYVMEYQPLETKNLPSILNIGGISEEIYTGMGFHFIEGYCKSEGYLDDGVGTHIGRISVELVNGPENDEDYEISLIQIGSESSSVLNKTAIHPLFHKSSNPMASIGVFMKKSGFYDSANVSRFDENGNQYGFYVDTRSCYMLVAKTRNNCYAVSSVFDFRPLKMKAHLVTKNNETRLKLYIAISRKWVSTCTNKAAIVRDYIFNHQFRINGRYEDKNGNMKTLFATPITINNSDKSFGVKDERRCLIVDCGVKPSDMKSDARHVKEIYIWDCTGLKHDCVVLDWDSANNWQIGL